MNLGILSRLKQALLFVATHYTGAFVTIMTLTLTSTLFSVWYLADLERGLNTVWENDVRGGEAVQTARVALGDVESGLKDLLLWSASGPRDRARTEVKKAHTQLKTAMDRAEPRFVTPKAARAFQKTQTDLRAYEAALAQALSTFTPETPRERWTAFVEASDRVRADLDLLVANRSANSAQGVEGLVDRLRFSLWVTVVILAVSVGVRVFLYWAGHPRRRPPTGPRQDAETGAD